MTSRLECGDWSRLRLDGESAGRTGVDNGAGIRVTSSHLGLQTPAGARLYSPQQAQIYCYKIAVCITIVGLLLAPLLLSSLWPFLWPSPWALLCRIWFVAVAVFLYCICFVAVAFPVLYLILFVY